MNANPAASVFFVVPDMIDDPERVSGGNVYDQRVRDGLTADGWELRMLPVADRQAETARTLSQLPEGALVLIDGLLVAREPDALLEQAPRLAVVVLAHGVAPDLGDRERDALRSARGIIATSRWTRAELIERDAADPHRIVVAHPGTEPAPPTVASASGGRLLCVATVAPHKGQDLLVRALTRVADIDGWTCTMAGSLRAAPEFVARLTDEVEAAGLTDRVTFTGVLSGSALEDAYGRADLAIAPSRHESYGMAVAEALARGIPVLASHVGGISEAIGESGGEAVAGEAAGGEAAMMRWLAPLLPGPQTWVLHDWNASLTQGAFDGAPPRDRDGGPVSIRSRVGELERLDGAHLENASLVTASALLDVLTAQEAHAIVDACVQAGAPVLLSLSVTGEVELRPGDVRDKLVERAFNDHQRREVHGRRLLGRYAAPIVLGLFGRAGWNTRKALTSWRLDDGEPRLLDEWFEGWVDAAEEQSPELRETGAGYRELRRSQLERGELSAVVYHLDLLAWPR